MNILANGADLAVKFLSLPTLGWVWLGWKRYLIVCRYSISMPLDINKLRENLEGPYREFLDIYRKHPETRFQITELSGGAVEAFVGSSNAYMPLSYGYDPKTDGEIGPFLDLMLTELESYATELKNLEPRGRP
jgi:hypothetical protein